MSCVEAPGIITDLSVFQSTGLVSAAVIKYEFWRQERLGAVSIAVLSLLPDSVGSRKGLQLAAGLSADGAPLRAGACRRRSSM